MYNTRAQAGINLKQRALVALFAALVVLASLAILPPASRAERTGSQPPSDPYYVVGIDRDFGLDANNDDFFDYLVVDLLVNTTVPGNYTLEGSIFYFNKFCGSDINTTLLPLGQSTVRLEFDNSKISMLYERNASFKLRTGIEYIDNGSGALVSGELALLGRYSSFDFSRPAADTGGGSGRYVPTATIQENSINVQSDIMEAVVNTSAPEAVFYYKQDNGSGAKFKVSYDRIIAYAAAPGTAFAAYGGETAVYTANLSTARWKLDGITYSGGADSGRFFQFQISSANVQFKAALPSTSVQDATGIVSIKYMIASRATDFSSFYSYPIQGGIELKIDIDIRMQTLGGGVSALALEQTIADLAGKHDYTVATTASGANETVKAAGTSAAIRPIETTNSGIQKIGLVGSGDGGIEHGYYAWSKSATAYNDTDYTNLTVKASYKIDGGRMKLYLTYPYTTNTKRIYHDPSVGINENYAPIGQIAEVVAQIVRNPAIYGLGWATAAVVIIATIWGRKRHE